MNVSTHFDVSVEYRMALHAAAYSGNVAGLQLVLAQGAEVNALDHSGFSALMVAADCGQTMAVGMGLKFFVSSCL